jgi:hypothetical protein
LSLRLWTGDDSTEPDPQFWSSSAPAVWLVSDLITASDGIPAATHNRILIASFTGIHAALSAARRIQWAIQGFAQTPGLQGTAVAILVQSTEAIPGQGEDDPFLRPLDHAAQGQILLTEETCMLLGDLPGFSLQATEGADVRELLWRASESECARARDEASLAQLIQQHPVQEPFDISVQPEPEATPAPAPAPARQVNDRIAIPPSSATKGKSPLLIGGVCAVVLIIAIAVFMARSSKSSEPAAAAPVAVDTTAKPITVATPSPTVSEPATTAAKPAEAAPAKETNKKETAKERREREAKERKEAALANKPEPPAPKPETPSRDCEYESSDIPGLLDGAEGALARGKYVDALRQFRAAIACEPHNGRALSGKARVEQVMAAGGR